MLFFCNVVKNIHFLVIDTLVDKCFSFKTGQMARKIHMVKTSLLHLNVNTYKNVFLLLLDE